MIAPIIATLLLFAASGVSGLLLYECIKLGVAPFATAICAILLIVCFLAFVASLFVTILIIIGR